jgi:uncharacterized protein
MLQGNAAVTVSGRKNNNLHIYVTVFLLCLFTLAAIFLSSASQPIKHVRIGSQSFAARTVITDEGRQRGLSYTETLGKRAGMLFVFENPSNHCFWMKDMKYPLDIIWLDESKKVVTIHENLQPESFPRSFCGAESSIYVLEVPAGSVEMNTIKLGEQASF